MPLSNIDISEQNNQLQLFLMKQNNDLQSKIINSQNKDQNNNNNNNNNNNINNNYNNMY